LGRDIVYGVGGTLRAVGFDLERLEVTSAPVPVLDGVITKTTGAANFGISRSGSLVYVSGPQIYDVERTLVWVDREGTEEPLTAEPRAYTAPRISPDGTRLALEVADRENDIWIWNFVRETLTRLTFDPARDVYPTWTPDGLRLAFGTGDRTRNLFSKAANGTGTVELLAESENSISPQAFSSDGKQLVIRESSEQGTDLGLLSLDGDGPAVPLLATEFDELNAEIAPDGHYLAYQSDGDSMRSTSERSPTSTAVAGRSREGAAPSRFGALTVASCSICPPSDN